MKFEQNDFGLVMRMVYGAITRNITPKHNTQHKMVERDLEMMYHILKGNKVNFAFPVMDWMMEKTAILHSLNYKDTWKQKKVGLPYGSILTDIFQRFGVDLSNLKGTPVTRNQTVHEGMLTSMKLYRTLNRG